MYERTNGHHSIAHQFLDVNERGTRDNEQVIQPSIVMTTSEVVSQSLTEKAPWEGLETQHVSSCRYVFSSFSFSFYCANVYFRFI